ncbi:MAG: hypothetical protein ACPG49_14305, partial [Chitinophagales bacterium]
MFLFLIVACFVAPFSGKALLTQIPQHPEFTNIPYTAEGAKYLAFDFAEQSKAVLLLSNLKDDEAKA